MFHFSTLDTLEFPIVKAIQNMDGTFFDATSMYISDIPFLLGTFMIIISTLIWKKHRLWKPLGVALVSSVSISYIINEGFFKILLTHFDVFRPRPWTIHPDILAIGYAFHDSSFPSSHMAFTTLFVMIIVYFEKTFLPFGILIILLMGISRIHNGMHYPSDVIIGTMMGISYGLVGLWLVKKFGLEKKPWWEKFF